MYPINGKGLILMNKEDERFQKSEQEKVKLSIALKRYFEVKEDELKAMYGDYLQYRIRPALERLIEEEALSKMQVLWENHWLNQELLERGMILAREHGKMQAHIWLMQRKTESYSFSGKDFSL